MATETQIKPKTFAELPRWTDVEQSPSYQAWDQKTRKETFDIWQQRFIETATEDPDGISPERWEGFKKFRKEKGAELTGASGFSAATQEADDEAATEAPDRLSLVARKREIEKKAAKLFGGVEVAKLAPEERDEYQKLTSVLGASDEDDFDAVEEVANDDREFHVTNGKFYASPSLALSKDRYREAVKNAPLTAEQKADALMQGVNLREEVGARLRGELKAVDDAFADTNLFGVDWMPGIGGTDKFNQFEKDLREVNPDATDADVMERWQEENGAWYSNLGTQIKLGALRTASNLIGTYYGVKRLAGVDDEETAARAEAAGTLSQQLSAGIEATGGATLAADATTMVLESLATAPAGLAGRGVVAGLRGVGTLAGRTAAAVTAGRVGAGTLATAAALRAGGAAAAKIEARRLAMAKAGGLAAASFAAGMQSAGGAFNQYFDEFLTDELSSIPEAERTPEIVEAARRRARDGARARAIVSGLITTAITAGFGATGAEKLAAPQVSKAAQAARESMAVFLGKSLGKEALSEATEEGLDEFINGLVDKIAIDPSKPISEIVADTLKAAVSGGLLGAGMSAPYALADLYEARKKAKQNPAIQQQLQTADNLDAAGAPASAAALRQSANQEVTTQADLDRQAAQAQADAEAALQAQPAYRPATEVARAVEERLNALPADDPQREELQQRLEGLRMAISANPDAVVPMLEPEQAATAEGAADPFAPPGEAPAAEEAPVATPAVKKPATVPPPPPPLDTATEEELTKDIEYRKQLASEFTYGEPDDADLQKQIADLEAKKAAKFPATPTSVPDWVKENAAAAAAQVPAETQQRVKELAADRKTAKKIAAETGLDVDTVQSLRVFLGIPPWTTATSKGGEPVESPEFTAWREKFLSAPPAPGPKNVLGKGAVVTSDVYRGEGDIIIAGDPVFEDGEWKYPATFTGSQRRGNLADRFVTTVKDAGAPPAQPSAPTTSPQTATTNESQTVPQTDATRFPPSPEGVGYPQARDGSRAVVTTPSAAIIGELAKLPSVEAKLNWLRENGFLTQIEGNNSVEHAGRVMVLMRIGSVNIPFYISTGMAGKKNVAVGKWYAVWGIGSSGWINKGREVDINTQYEFPVLQKLAKILNEGIGTINPDSVKELGSFAGVNSKMNMGFTPAADPSDQTFWPNVKQALTRINEETKKLWESSAPAPTQPVAPTPAAPAPLASPVKTPPQPRTPKTDDTQAKEPQAGGVPPVEGQPAVRVPEGQTETRAPSGTRQGKAAPGKKLTKAEQRKVAIEETRRQTAELTARLSAQATPAAVKPGKRGKAAPAAAPSQQDEAEARIVEGMLRTGVIPSSSEINMAVKALTGKGPSNGSPEARALEARVRKAWTDAHPPEAGNPDDYFTGSKHGPDMKPLPAKKENIDKAGGAVPFKIVNGERVGFFTNDPVLTAKQINSGLKVTVPAELRGKLANGIEIDEATGRVTAAYDYSRGSTPVTKAGDWHALFLASPQRQARIEAMLKEGENVTNKTGKTMEQLADDLRAASNRIADAISDKRPMSPEALEALQKEQEEYKNQIMALQKERDPRIPFVGTDAYLAQHAPAPVPGENDVLKEYLKLDSKPDADGMSYVEATVRKTLELQFPWLAGSDLVDTMVSAVYNSAMVVVRNKLLTNPGVDAASLQLKLKSFVTLTKDVLKKFSDAARTHRTLITGTIDDPLTPADQLTAGLAEEVAAIDAEVEAERLGEDEAAATPLTEDEVNELKDALQEMNDGEPDPFSLALLQSRPLQARRALAEIEQGIQFKVGTDGELIFEHGRSLSTDERTELDKILDGIVPPGSTDLAKRLAGRPDVARFLMEMTSLGRAVLRGVKTPIGAPMFKEADIRKKNLVEVFTVVHTGDASTAGRIVNQAIENISAYSGHSNLTQAEAVAVLRALLTESSRPTEVSGRTAPPTTLAEQRAQERVATLKTTMEGSQAVVDRSRATLTRIETRQRELRDRANELTEQSKNPNLQKGAKDEIRAKLAKINSELTTLNEDHRLTDINLRNATDSLQQATRAYAAVNVKTTPPPAEVLAAAKAKVESQLKAAEAKGEAKRRAKTSPAPTKAVKAGVRPTKAIAPDPVNTAEDRSMFKSELAVIGLADGADRTSLLDTLKRMSLAGATGTPYFKSLSRIFGDKPALLDGIDSVAIIEDPALAADVSVVGGVLTVNVAAMTPTLDGTPRAPEALLRGLVTHAVTQLTTPGLPLTTTQQAALAKLEELRQEAAVMEAESRPDGLQPRFTDALKDTASFMQAVLTSPEFGSMLQSYQTKVKTPGLKSAWGRFWLALGELLTGKPMSFGSGLHASLMTAGNLMAKSPSPGKRFLDSIKAVLHNPEIAFPKSRTAGAAEIAHQKAANEAVELADSPATLDTVEARLTGDDSAAADPEGVAELDAALMPDDAALGSAPATDVEGSRIVTVPRVQLPPPAGSDLLTEQQAYAGLADAIRTIDTVDKVARGVITAGEAGAAVLPSAIQSALDKITTAIERLKGSPATNKGQFIAVLEDMQAFLQLELDQIVTPPAKFDAMSEVVGDIDTEALPDESDIPIPFAEVDEEAIPFAEPYIETVVEDGTKEAIDFAPFLRAAAIKTGRKVAMVDAGPGVSEQPLYVRHDRADTVIYMNRDAMTELVKKLRAAGYGTAEMTAHLNALLDREASTLAILQRFSNGELLATARSLSPEQRRRIIKRVYGLNPGDPGFLNYFSTGNSGYSPDVTADMIQLGADYYRMMRQVSETGHTSEDVMDMIAASPGTFARTIAFLKATANQFATWWRAYGDVNATRAIVNIDEFLRAVTPAADTATPAAPLAAPAKKIQKHEAAALIAARTGRTVEEVLADAKLVQRIRKSMKQHVMGGDRPDTTVMTNAQAQEFVKALGLVNRDPGSIATALARIADMDTVNPAFRVIARQLSQNPKIKSIADLQFVTDLTVKVDGREVDSAGSYDPDLNVLSMELPFMVPEFAVNTDPAAKTTWSQASVVETLIHEAVHAATSLAVKDYEAGVDMDPEAKAAVEGLIGLRKSIANQEGADQFSYQLSSLDEFIAGVSTDPNFVAWLASLPPSVGADVPGETGSKSIIKRILRRIYRIIFPQLKGDSALQKSLNRVFDLAAYPHLAQNPSRKVLDKKYRLKLSRTAMRRNRDREAAAEEAPLPQDEVDLMEYDMAAEADALALPFPLYHGTPHKVARFLMSKIGTGEGAQAFGYGLYFAQRKSVAEGYQKTLAKKRLKSSSYDGEKYDGTNPKHVAAEVLARFGSRDAATEALLRDIESNPEKDFNEAVVEVLRQKQEAKIVDNVFDTKGNLYTVEILPEDEEFLDWFAPLSKQSMLVEEKLLSSLSVDDAYTVGYYLLGEPLFLPNSYWDAELNSLDSEEAKREFLMENLTGRDLYKALAELYSPKEASEMLSKAGLAGIRYQDALSRKEGAKEVTRNYVVFDEKDIKITEENGNPVNMDSVGSVLYPEAGSSGVLASPMKAAPVSATDAKYLELAKDPKKNRGALQRMVDAAAKAAGYARKMFHRTKAKVPFDVFKTSSSEMGAHFGTKEQVADISKRGGKLPDREFYIKAKNPFRMQDYGGFSPDGVVEELLREDLVDDEFAEEIFDADNKTAHRLVQEKLIELGYDSIIYLNRHEGVKILEEDNGSDLLDDWDGAFLEKYPQARDSIIVFKPSQIKAADLVIYNKDGTPVPLSQRFNPKSPSILASPMKAPPSYLPGKVTGERKSTEALKNSLPAMPARVQDYLKGSTYFSGVAKADIEVIDGLIGGALSRATGAADFGSIANRLASLPMTDPQRFLARVVVGQALNKRVFDLQEAMVKAPTPGGLTMLAAFEAEAASVWHTVQDIASTSGQMLSAAAIARDLINPRTVSATYRDAATKVSGEKLPKDAKDLFSELKREMDDVASGVVKRSTLTKKIVEAMTKAAGGNPSEVQMMFDFMDTLPVKLLQDLRDRGTGVPIPAKMADWVADRIFGMVETKIREQVKQVAGIAGASEQTFFEEYSNEVKRLVALRVNAALADVAPPSPDLTPSQQEAAKREALDSAIRKLVASFDYAPSVERAFNQSKAKLLARLEADKGSTPEALKQYEAAKAAIAAMELDIVPMQMATDIIRRSFDMREQVYLSLSDQHASVAQVAAMISSAAGLTADQSRKVAEAFKTAYEAEANRRIQKTLTNYAQRRSMYEGRGGAERYSRSERFLRLARIGGLRKEEFYNAMATEFGLPSYDPAIAEELDREADRIAAMPVGSVQRNDATRELNARIVKETYRNLLDTYGAKAIVKDRSMLAEYIAGVPVAMWKSAVLSGFGTAEVNFGYGTIQSVMDLGFNASAYAVKAKDPALAASNLLTLMRAVGWIADPLGRKEVWTEIKRAALTGRTRFASEQSENMLVLERDIPTLDTPGIKQLMSSAKTFYKLLGRIGAVIDATVSVPASLARQRLALQYALTMGGADRQKIKEVLRKSFSPEELESREINAIIDSERDQFRNSPRPDLAMEARRYQLLEQRRAQTYAELTSRMEAKDKEDFMEASRESARFANLGTTPTGIAGAVFDSVFGKFERKTKGLSSIIVSFPRAMGNLLDFSLAMSFPFLSFARANNVSPSRWFLSENSRYQRERVEGGSVKYWKLMSQGLVAFVAQLAVGAAYMAGLEDEEEGRVPWFMVYGKGYPDSERNRQLRYRQPKWSPYTVKVGDFYLSWKDIPGFNLLLGGLASITDMRMVNSLKDPKKIKELEYLADASVAFIKAVTVKNSLQGLAQAGELLSDNDLAEAMAATDLGKMVGNFIGGVTNPRLLRDVASIGRGLAGGGQYTLKDTRGLTAVAISMLPANELYGAELGQRDMVNTMGDPVTNFWYAPVTKRILPSTAGPTVDPIITPLVSAGLFLSPPKGSQMSFDTYEDGSDEIDTEGGLLNSFEPEVEVDAIKMFGEQMRERMTPEFIKELTDLAAQGQEGRKAAQKMLNDQSTAARDYAKRIIQERIFNREIVPHWQAK